MMPKPDFDGMVRELLAYDPEAGQPRLTEWEVSFLDSVAKPMRSDFSGKIVPWTPKQREKVEQIWEAVFG